MQCSCHASHAYSRQDDATGYIEVASDTDKPRLVLKVRLSGFDLGVFTEINNCPASLAAGTFCSISVTFTPSAAMKQTGTLTITDNAHGITQTVPLSGTGK